MTLTSWDGLASKKRVDKLETRRSNDEVWHLRVGHREAGISGAGPCGPGRELAPERAYFNNRFDEVSQLLSRLLSAELENGLTGGRLECALPLQRFHTMTTPAKACKSVRRALDLRLPDCSDHPRHSDSSAWMS